MNQSLSLLIRLFLPAILSCAFLTSGCKKEESMATQNSNNNEKIIGTWNLKEELQDQSNTGNYINVLQSCDLDDTWTFTTYSILFINKNGTTCDPILPINFTTSWKLQENETVLYLDFGSGFDKYKIFELNDAVLVLHRPMSLNNIDGKVYSKMTFKK